MLLLLLLLMMMLMMMMMMIDDYWWWLNIIDDDDDDAGLNVYLFFLFKRRLFQIIGAAAEQKSFVVKLSKTLSDTTGHDVWPTGKW